MIDKIFSILGSVVAIGYCLGAPFTFVYLIATHDNWTLLNAIPTVIIAALASSVWILYWPINFLFF